MLMYWRKALNLQWFVTDKRRSVTTRISHGCHVLFLWLPVSIGIFWVRGRPFDLQGVFFYLILALVMQEKHKLAQMGNLKKIL